MIFIQFSALLGDEREEGDETCLFDGDRQQALMAGAIPADATRQNLPALRNVLAQPCDVFIVDLRDLVDAEITNLAFRTPLFFRGVPLLGSAAGHRFLFSKPRDASRGF